MSHRSNDEDDRFVLGDESFRVNYFVSAERHEYFSATRGKMEANGIPNDLKQSMLLST